MDLTDPSPVAASKAPEPPVYSNSNSATEVGIASLMMKRQSATIRLSVRERVRCSSSIVMLSL